MKTTTSNKEREREREKKRRFEAYGVLVLSFAPCLPRYAPRCESGRSTEIEKNGILPKDVKSVLRMLSMT